MQQKWCETEPVASHGKDEADGDLNKALCMSLRCGGKESQKRQNDRIH